MKKLNYTKFLIKKNTPNLIMKYFRSNFYFKRVIPYPGKNTRKTKNLTPNIKTFTRNLIFFSPNQKNFTRNIKIFTPN